VSREKTGLKIEKKRAICFNSSLFFLNMSELPKTYEPVPTEAPWYPYWEKQRYFEPKSGDGTSYAIVIPPPNVTGSLHMGHALNATLQDILIRWRRMSGDRAVWVPGTDHGGIATQNVVEKLLRAEKKTRFDLGRDAFLERMWQWRKESGDTILMQLRRLGASCDWTRTRFTMDEACSLAVREAFVRLFKKGLIYRGPRMINWCPRCGTALADIEVEHEERAGKLWHIRYPYADGNGYLIVATTRPETLLGDTAVAVNAEDARYSERVGQKLKLPLTTREIPLITDEAVEAAFGSGAVKVTPAHDQTDYDIGERHQLPHVVVINFEGKMTDKAGAYAGLDRFEARKRVLEDLEAQGLLDKVEDYRLSVAECYRCQTVVEPLVSEQWFLNVKTMAERAAEATRTGRVKIYPASWEKPYIQWMDNIRDWCISRQIWWGHRIPVYYCANKACPPIASVETPKECSACHSPDLRQDNDVLDTWFSSGLWPMSVFGWPAETADLKSFYPTNVLVTGHEILYLWVARMVMFGLEFRDEVPFKHVYIHGIVRDKQGKKMSKSLGNVIDPLEKMKQFGTDALRFSLAESSIPGRDLHLSDDSFLKARNFANKLWNASRFVLMNLEEFKPQPLPPQDKLELADRWILHELQETAAAVSENLGRYNPAEAARRLYEFTWNSLCDWYLEIAKVALTGQDETARATKHAVLVHVLDNTLRLLHPMMPFETEALFDALKPYIANPPESLMIAPWPVPDTQRIATDAGHRMRLVQNVVTALRTLRSESMIPPGTKLKALVREVSADWQSVLRDPDVQAFIVFLARLEVLDVEFDSKTRPSEFLFTVFDGGEIFVPAAGLVDKEKERIRLNKNIAQIDQMLTRGEAQLANPDFVRRAPAEEVERLRTQIEQMKMKSARLKKNLEGLA
jgi:valyl-tRNA synthetase